MQEVGKIPFGKALNLNLIDKQVDKIMANLRPYYEATCTGDEFNRFVIDLHSLLPVTVSIDIIYASVMNSAGKPLSREYLQALAWRLAGNMKLLKDGIVVPEWLNQTTLEWVPISIRSVTPGKSYSEKPGCFVNYLVLAGTPAGLSFTTFWTINQARLMAYNLGFKTKGKNKFPFTSFVELTRMRFYGLLDPQLSKDNSASFSDFRVPGTVLKYNREILKTRFRLNPCPLGYELHELACHNCPVGYGTCIAGCHPTDYPITEEKE